MQLVQLVTAKTAEGRNTETEGDKIGLWADISNTSGFRTADNGQTQLGTTKNFLIRFRMDKYPNCNWKIRYEGKDWTISTIQKVDEKRFYWRMTATSKADV